MKSIEQQGAISFCSLRLAMYVKVPEAPLSPRLVRSGSPTRAISPARYVLLPLRPSPSPAPVPLSPRQGPLLGPTGLAQGRQMSPQQRSVAWAFRCQVELMCGFRGGMVLKCFIIKWLDDARFQAESLGGLPRTPAPGPSGVHARPNRSS